MSFTLADLAARVGGTLVGDGSTPITGAATLETAGPADATLVDTPERLHLLAKSKAAAAIVPAGSGPLDRPTIEVPDVHAAFAAAVTHFRPPRARVRAGVSPKADVHPSARLAADAEVGAFATIGPDVEVGAGATIHPGAHVMAGSRIGANAEIFPGAVLYENTVVGERAIVHAGAVLGAHGFGYRPTAEGYRLSAQLGWVELGPDVEVGANTTVDRGTYGPTVIGSGSKLDNLVMIAHNVRVGRHAMICSQVGVAGSTSTGDWVVMAGQVGVRDHVHIGDRAVLGARSGVSSDIEAGKTVLGEPAIDLRDRKLQLATMSKLPEMRKDLKTLAARVEALEHRGGRAADAA